MLSIQRTTVFVPGEIGYSCGKFVTRWLVRDTVTGGCIGGHHKTKKAAQETLRSEVVCRLRAEAE